MEETDKEIRKLRKKLRQIHNLLSLSRDLNEEEDEKVERFDELQSKLDELLRNKGPTQTFQCSGDVAGEVNLTEDEDESRDDVENEGEEDVEECEGEETIDESETSSAEVSTSALQQNESHSAALEQTSQKEVEGPTPIKFPRIEEKPRSVSVSKQERKTTVSNEVDIPSKSRGSKAEEKQVKPQRPTKSTKEDIAPKKMVPWWKKKSRYFIQELVGHSDIILDVSIADGLIASASRDTVVKVWCTDTGLLECTLSGHVEAVNACICVPVAVSNKLSSKLQLSSCSRLVISGGRDSSLLLWKVNTNERRGSEIMKIYVFTPVTCMALLPREETLVVAIGTSSGKVELWDVLSKTQIGCRSDYRSAVASLRVAPADDEQSPERIISCSEDGEIAIHVVSNLAPVFRFGDVSPHLDHAPRKPINDASVILPVGSNTDWLIVGDGGSSLKVLQRGYKQVKRIPNSKNEFGACDGLWCLEDGSVRLIISTSFDIDTGGGLLNVFNVTNPSQPVYLLSLQPRQFFGRFLCLDADRRNTGDFPDVLVTGGTDLLLWQRVTPEDDYNTSELTTGRILSLFRRPEDEWSHGESGDSSDEWSDNEDANSDDEKQSGSRWWCHLL